MRRGIMDNTNPTSSHFMYSCSHLEASAIATATETTTAT